MLELRPRTEQEKAADFWHESMELAENTRLIAESKQNIAQMEAKGVTGPALDAYKRELAKFERIDAEIRAMRARPPDYQSR